MTEMYLLKDSLSLFDYNLPAHSIADPLDLGKHSHGRYYGHELEC